MTMMNELTRFGIQPLQWRAGGPSKRHFQRPALCNHADPPNPPETPRGRRTGGGRAALSGDDRIER